MTREQATQNIDEIDFLTWQIDIIEDMLDKIFNDYEAQLKAKESDLERQDMIIKCLNIDLDNKEKLLKAKYEEIERLKKLVNDFNNTYSVGDFDFESYYAMLKEN